MRSLKLFRRCGFLPEDQAPALEHLVMTSTRYRQRLRESTAGRVGDIQITEADLERLRHLVASEPASTSFELEHEIERAIVVESRRVTQDVVTMNSVVLPQLDDDLVEVALVYPEDADHRAGRLSVGAGIGTAILGYREGDAVVWRLPERTCRIRIGQVLYQPEAAGEFHL